MNIAVVFIRKIKLKISFSISSKVLGLFAFAIIRLFEFSTNISTLLLFLTKSLFITWAIFDADEFLILNVLNINFPGCQEFL